MTHVHLDASVGYALKRAQATLRNAMDAALREHGLSVPQYSCLELLTQRPNLPNAELARGAFVTRQAMYQLLAGLSAAGLVTSAGRGRSERYRCTDAGARRLAGSSQAVAAIEERMLARLAAPERARLHADLEACIAALDAERRESRDPA